MKADKFILALESSCDDTSAAIVSLDYRVVSQLTSSQPQHDNFGGVLPELASRLHMRNMMQLTEKVMLRADLSFPDLAAVAVSINPGLIGSLIVGLAFAKSLSWSISIPLITINHMLGHVFANHLSHQHIAPPYLALVVSGGHTELVLFESDIKFTQVGKTLDDAAGETFDKAAKMLHLGYPGGPLIDKLAASGDSGFYNFPLALRSKDNYNFSYSGLKTAILQYCANQSASFISRHKADLAASIQTAIITPLVNKTIRYARLNNIKTILMAGGVAANSMLRESMLKEAAAIHVNVLFPPMELCMDNAAMVGAAAVPKFEQGLFADLAVNAFSTKGLRFV